MKPGGPKNIVASIQARLVQRSHELDVEHQLTPARFGGERLLYRLSKSEFADRFILKGTAPPSGASLTVPRPLRIELKGNLAAMLGAAQNAKRSPEDSHPQADERVRHTGCPRSARRFAALTRAARSLSYAISGAPEDRRHRLC